MGNILFHLNVFKIENEEKDVVDKVPVVELQSEAKLPSGLHSNNDLFRLKFGIASNGKYKNEKR
jgi:hypothetical protein